MREKHGEYIFLYWEGGPDAWFVRGHVSDEEFRSVILKEEDVSHYGTITHAYGRWSVDAGSESDLTLCVYRYPGRGRFPLTGANEQGGELVYDRNDRINGMSDRSKISWTDATWGVTRGCKIVSEGCRNCYAMRFAHRFPKVYPGLTVASPSGPKWTGQIQLVPEKLDQPLRWKRPRRIFVNSMSDLFHDDVPDAYIAAVFAVMAATPRHTYQLLTKRAERMQCWVQVYHRAPEFWQDCAAAHGIKLDLSEIKWPLKNVLFGVSIEDQETANERIPPLLRTYLGGLPGLHWVSAEPLLGPVDFNMVDMGSRIPMLELGWIVTGGESGPGARPPNPEWFRRMRDQCQAFCVPFHFKQWGEWLPFSNGYPGFHWVTDEHDGGSIKYLDYARVDGKKYLTVATDATDPISYVKIGKKAAGRELDGRTWDEYPEVAA